MGKAVVNKNTPELLKPELIRVQLTAPGVSVLVGGDCVGSSVGGRRATFRLPQVVIMLLPFLLLLPLVFSKSIPAACSYQNGDYSLFWYYDDLSSDVVFKLSAKAAYSNFWTGVLMGESEPTDVIGLFVQSGQIGLTDAHVSESTIITDNLTNVQSLSFDLTEDKLTAEFARPLTPQDESDADLNRCVTFFFPVLPTEIPVGEAISLPREMESRRVCEIADTCVQRDQIAVVKKREEAPLCEYKKDKQTVSWKHEDDKYIFVFDIPVKKGKWWSSIGVGESMQELSMAVAFAESGKVKTAQGFTSSGYQLPLKDGKNAHQVKLISSTVKNGKAHTEFSVNEDFIKEKEIQGCVTLQVAVNAGQFVTGPKLHKHNSLPIAVQVCGIEQCGQDTKKPAETVLNNNQLNKDGETIVDTKSEPKEVIVDARKETTVAPESVVDVKTTASNDSVVDVQPKNESTIPTISAVDVKELEGAGGQVVEPGTVVDVRNSTTDQGASGSGVNTSENKNEIIVVFSEVTPKLEEKEQIVDAEQDKRQEDVGQVAIGTADEKKEEEKANHGKKTTKRPKKGEKKGKTTKHPEEQIVDAQEETVEGSGDHIEGSGDLAGNETLGEDQMDVLTNNETEHTRPPIVNVDGVVDPKVASTTFSPPVSIPKLHAADSSSPALAAGTTQNPLLSASAALNVSSTPSASGPAVSAPSNPLTTPASQVIVPKTCDHPEDLKICDGYFNDYLSKVQEWSAKHNHTVETSMFKACRLLSQVKHVPTMCCNLYRKTCEAYSRQP